MGSISRYIFRTTLNAFLVVLVSLTAVIGSSVTAKILSDFCNDEQIVPALECVEQLS